jgi:hypothetical protein
MVRSTLASRKVRESAHALSQLLGIYGPDAVRFTINGRSIAQSRPLAALLKVVVTSVSKQHSERLKLEPYPPSFAALSLANDLFPDEAQLDQFAGRMLENAAEIEALVGGTDPRLQDPQAQMTAEQMERMPLWMRAAIQWDQVLPGDDVITVNRSDRDALRLAYGACKTLGRQGSWPKIAVQIGGDAMPTPHRLPSPLARILQDFIELTVGDRQAVCVRVSAHIRAGELTT